MKGKYDTWLKAIILIWLWASALVVYTGWAGAWGMIPLGREVGVWMLPVAAILTVLLFIVKAGQLESVIRRFGFLELHSWSRPFRLAAFSAFYILILLFAWFFRSRDHFMGDGWALSEKVGWPFFYYHNEPLDFFIHQLFYRWLKLFDIFGGETAYALLHCLLLPVFLIVCWKIAVQLTRDPVERVALWMLAISTTSLQLFFGYVESYTLLHLWLAVYLLSGIRYFRQDRQQNPWLPTAIFLLAVVTHRSAVVVFPSLLFLWFERSLFSGRIKRYPGSSLSVFLVSGLALILVLVMNKVPGLIPVAGPIDGADNPYRMLESEHLWDKLNFLLLICPAAVVTAPVLVAGWKPLAKIKDSALAFVFWCAAGCGFFFFVINPHLGVRDWDLLSLPALPLAVFSGCGLVLLLNKKGRGKVSLFFFAAALVVHSFTWVWVNADINRGVRFLDLVRRADYHLGAAKVHLGYLLRERGFFEESFRQYKLVEGKLKNRAFLNLVQNYWELGMPDSTIYYCKNLLDEDPIDTPESIPLYVVLCLAYDSREKPDSATIYYLTMRSKGLQPEKTARAAWIIRMSQMAARYNQLIFKNPLDEKILQFFLRYYTIKQNEGNLGWVYRHILRNEFQGGAWMKFLGFAVICEHEDYIELLAKEALRQHPELDISIEYSDQEEVKNAEH